MSAGSGCDRLSEEHFLTAAQTVVSHGKGSCACEQSVGTTVGGYCGAGVENGAAHPVETIGLSGALQGAGQVEGVHTDGSTRDVLNQVGSLTIDVNGQIPVGVTVGYQGSVASRSRHEDSAVRDCSTHVSSTASQHNLVVDVGSVRSRHSQVDVIQGIIAGVGQVVGRCDQEYFGSVQVDAGGTTLNVYALEVVANSIGTGKINLLNRQSYRPVLVGVQGEHAGDSCRGTSDGVLTVVEQTHLNAVSYQVGRLINSCFSGLTEHLGLVAQLVIGNVVTNPLIDGVVNEVLVTFYEISGCLVGSEVLVLVDIGDQERTWISQGHPLVVVAFAVSSSSSAHEGTASSVKLSICGRGDQVALILLTVKSGGNALSVVLRYTL